MSPLHRKNLSLLALTGLLATGLASAAATTASAATTTSAPGAARTVSGVLVEEHGDHLRPDPKGGSVTHRDFHLRGRNGARTQLLGVDPASVRGLIGKPVVAAGKGEAGRLDVALGAVAADSAAAPSAAGSGGQLTTQAVSVKKVAVLLVNFSDDLRTPWTREQIASTVFTGQKSVNAFYTQQSDGQLSITGNVTGYYTVQRTTPTSCDYSTWSNAARSAATAAGVDLSTYTNVMYVWAWNDICSWAGLGELPGSNTWINGFPDMRVIAHELGHNLGLHHASTTSCTDATGARVPWSSTCTANEYGDPYSVMGHTSVLGHNASRAHLGHITPVVTASAGGTYTLLPATSTTSTTGTRLLRVPRGDGSWLALELREPALPFDDFAPTSPAVTGVSVRVDYGYGSRQTLLLDMTPSTTDAYDFPLPAGRSYTDPVSGVSISVDSVSSAGAVVRTSASSDQTPPSAITGLGFQLQSAGSVQLHWDVATDNVQVAGYRVIRQRTVDGVTSTVDLGLATTNGAIDTPPAGTSTYRVNAVDTAGNAGRVASTTVTVSGPDTTAPTAVTGLTSTVKGKSLVVSWRAASDDRAVTGYVVSRTGLADRTTTSLSVSDKLPTSTVTYAVRARDAAGNLSAPASITFPR